MQLTRWNPRRRVGYRSSLFPGIMDEFFSPVPAGRTVHHEGFMPPVDIYEKDDSVFFEAEVPGFSKENLSVDVKGKIITISGEREEDEKIEEKNSYRRERRYGKFERSFQLGFEADNSAVKAEYKNGILKVEIPKPEEKKVKQIQIH